jgi:hypothetical protein
MSKVSRASWRACSGLNDMGLILAREGRKRDYDDDLSQKAPWELSK